MFHRSRSVTARAVTAVSRLLFSSCLLVPATALGGDAPAAESDRDEAPWDEADWGEGDDAEGFAAAPSAAASAPPLVPSGPVAEPKRGELAVVGFLRSENALWTERVAGNPWAKLRQSLDASLRYRKEAWRIGASFRAARDLAYRIERDSYSQSTLDAYEEQVLLDEAYGNWSIPHFDLTLGKQVIAWGHADLVSPLDVVSPRDNREPGVADPADLRLGVWASRLDLSLADHRLELLVVHRADFGLRSPVLGPLNALTVLFANATASGVSDVRFVDPAAGWRVGSQQYFARWSFAGPGIDLALYAASALDSFGVLGALEPASSNPSRLNFVVEHPRYGLLAHSGSLASGAWLLEWELATFFRHAFDLAPAEAGQLDAGRLITTQYTGLASVTYSGFAGHTLTLEATDSVFTTSVPLRFPFEHPTYAFRSHHGFLHDDLTVETLFTGFGAKLEYGFLARAELSYAVSDAFRATVGYVTYQPGDDFGFLSGFESHDRFMLNLRYHFALE